MPNLVIPFLSLTCFPTGSYDTSCTAYEDSHSCFFGTNATTCTPIPSGSCQNLTLTKQLSTAKCEVDVTFGCVAGFGAMYAAGGCRGEFRCNGEKVLCASMRDTNTTCPCPSASGLSQHGQFSGLKREGSGGLPRQRAETRAPGSDFQVQISDTMLHMVYYVCHIHICIAIYIVFSMLALSA